MMAWTSGANALLLVAIALLWALYARFWNRRQDRRDAGVSLDALAMSRGDHAYVLALRSAAAEPGTVLHSRTDALDSGIEPGAAVGSNISTWAPAGSPSAAWHAELISTGRAPEPLLNEWTDHRGRTRYARLVAHVFSNGTALVKVRDETDLMDRLRTAEARADAADERYADLKRFVGAQFDEYAQRRASSQTGATA